MAKIKEDLRRHTFETSTDQMWGKTFISTDCGEYC